MANGKYANGKRLNVKPIVALLAIVMLVGAAVGGTLAWFTDQTDAVENTFTVGNINIELTETPNTDSNGDNKNDIWQGKMVPGVELDKDPIVTVKGKSEDCWVFLKVTESGGEVTVDTKTHKFDDFISYKIDPNNWTALNDEEGIYYCLAEDISSDRPIKVLGYEKGTEYVNNKVLVKETVTKQMMDALENTDSSNLPKLTFNAYAIQMAGFDKVEDAWISLHDSLNP